LSSHSGQVQFEKYNDTGAKAGLNLPTIASLKCLFPSLNEQAEISKIIDALDSKVSIQKVELSKHEMVKKGLMQDLLTGKVQVTA
jgi:type I restriction enzyme S subunit